MKKIFFLLAAVLISIAAKATNEVYTSYNDATKTLTYYFDDQREVRQAAGETTELYDPVNKRAAKRFITYHDDVLTAKIDVSMQNANLTSMYMMFSGCYDENEFYSLSNMTEIQGMENLVTDNVTEMDQLFFKCQSLQSVDVSHFNTANVTNMGNMFNGCHSLQSVDLSNFNTANVTFITNMFKDCQTLQMLDLCSFSMVKVTQMVGMFTGCTALKTIYSNTDWSEQSTVLQNSDNMFRNCTSLIGCAGTTFADAQVLDIQYARPDGGTDAPGYFTPKQNEIYTVYTDYVGYEGTGSITYYYDDQRLFREGITEVYDPSHPEKPRFKDYWASITAVIIDQSMKNADLRSTACMFGASSYYDEYYYLENVGCIIGMENLVTDNVTNMSYMFNGCYKLVSVDVSHLNTENVRQMEFMFGECKKLASLDLSHFNTAKVTDMRAMFENCKKLTELDVSSFNTANVTNMRAMFHGCSGLASLGLASFNTANVTDMSAMFDGCSGLASLGLASFNTAKVTNMNGMFWECSALDSLGLASFNTAQVTNMGSMFRRCSNLRVVDIHSFSIASLTNAGSMFDECGELKTIYCNGDWSQSELLVNSEKMFKDCIKLCSTREDGIHGTCYVPGADRDKKWARPDKEGANGYFTPIKEPYTLFDPETGTLTFYYDAKRTSREGIGTLWIEEQKVQMDGYTADQVTKVVISNSFKNLELTTVYSMFWGLSAAQEIVGLSNLNTAHVTNFGGMFCGCSSLTELELYDMDISSAEFVNLMFDECTSLKTIYCQSDWSSSKAKGFRYMFCGCTALVGGRGTKCDGSCSDQSDESVKMYARPDRGKSKPGYFTIPSGELHRFFTINDNGDKVVFSKGNLQYKSGTWRFADNQWEYSCTGWRTKFGWGTGDDPTSTVNKSEFVDWGTNAITKGAMEPGYWRTLTATEWVYIFDKRESNTYLKGKATINGITGTVLLPEHWSTPEGLNFTSGLGNSNTYTPEQWAVMEAAGAVFLPKENNNSQYYWSSTAASTNEAYGKKTDDNTNSSLTKNQQSFVRLVRDTVLPQPEPVEAYETLEPYAGEVKEIGVFSIGDVKKVTFSQGNLQYKASADTYRFAENQYDYISEADNKRIGINSTLWIDHFGWGTGDRPYLYATNDDNYSKFVDWGINPIWNGGNEPGQWRTLTGDEWNYLLTNTKNRPERLRSRATVEGVPGFIILPDEWVKPDDINISTGNPQYTSNNYNAEQWSKLEQAGAVFLPAAGYSNMNESSTSIPFDKYLKNGYYWTASESTTAGYGRFFLFENTGWIPGYGSYHKHFGMCVRLVKDFVVEPIPADKETKFDFGVINEEGSEILGVSLAEEDKYNEAEKRMEIKTTYDADSINKVIKNEWDGKIAPKTFLPGTINFFLEQTGEGDMEIDCQTNGYVLSVGLAEYGKATITATIDQQERGKATVHYTISQPTYVVIYLYSASSGSAARRRHGKKTEDAGAHIYAIRIAPSIPKEITAKQDPDDAGFYYSTFFDSDEKHRLPNNGTEAYSAKINSDGDMVLTKVAEGDQVLPANKAVILKATTSSLALTPSEGSPVSVPADNQLLGVDEPTAAPENCYVLSGHSTDRSVVGVGFYAFDGTIPAHKAYLIYNGSAKLAPSHRMRFIFNDTQTATGIEDAQSDNVQSTKVLINGQLFIIRNGVKYDARGQVIK